MSVQEFKEMGLVSDHSYAVISAHVVEGKSGEERILKLRNPWGHKEWCGRWSEESDDWTPELMEELGHTLDDDGVFFISEVDYMSYFRSTIIC